MPRPSVLAAVLAAVPALTGCPGDGAPGRPEVTVFAAASTTEPVARVTERVGRERGLEVRTAFAASSTLARQIEHGAPADIYISADPAWMDHLEGRGLLEPGTRQAFLGNDLVLVAPADEPLTLDLADPRLDLPAAFAGRLALADPAHVPAGVYARRALQELGWWERLRGRLVPAADVRAALALVERGECPLGVVYATDARASTRVALAGTFPGSSHPPIRYDLAVVKGRRSPAVDAVVAALLGDAEAWQRAGFRPLAAEEP